jgi:arylsulfatase A-like enzyme
MPTGHLSYPGLLDMLEIPDSSSGTMAIKPEFSEQIIAAKDRMVRCDKWKLVFQPLDDGHILKLFDVEVDPSCLYDLAADQPEITSKLWARLAAWMSQDSIYIRPD